MRIDISQQLQSTFRTGSADDSVKESTNEHIRHVRETEERRQKVEDPAQVREQRQATVEERLSQVMSEQDIKNLLYLANPFMRQFLGENAGRNFDAMS